jgi:hypothetical protein
MGVVKMKMTAQKQSAVQDFTPVWEARPDLAAAVVAASGVAGTWMRSAGMYVLSAERDGIDGFAVNRVKAALVMMCGHQAVEFPIQADVDNLMKCGGQGPSVWFAEMAERWGERGDLPEYVLRVIQPVFNMSRSGVKSPNKKMAATG